MQYRLFGNTGLSVSERGFGAWAIGGQSYGPVEPRQAFDALAQAEDLGCNFVDMAAVYGESESLLGRFLRGRRSKWLIATKYSRQPQGMSALVDQQLRRLGTDHVDFYQVHWAPTDREESLYEELAELKRSGKIRYFGVSLRTTADVKRVLRRQPVDGIQLCLSLLDPDPLSSCRALLQEKRTGVIARSALRSGFLCGKYDRSSTFSGPADQRAAWTKDRLHATAAQVQAFSFVTESTGSLHSAAVAYPLSFREVSTVILGCKDREQAAANFAVDMPLRLNPQLLQRIEQTQREQALFHTGLVRRTWQRALETVRRLGQ